MASPGNNAVFPGVLSVEECKAACELDTQSGNDYDDDCLGVTFNKKTLECTMYVAPPTVFDSLMSAGDDILGFKKVGTCMDAVQPPTVSTPTSKLCWDISNCMFQTKIFE